MKPDNDFFASTLISKHDSKPFESNNSVLDTTETTLNMKESQNGKLHHSDSFRKEAGQFAFTNKELYQSDGCEKNPDSLAFGAEVKDEFWGELVDDLSKFSEGVRDSPTKENQNDDPVAGNVQPWSSDIKYRNPFGDDLELQTSAVANEFTNYSADNDQKHTTVLDSHETESKLFTDKEVVECDLPDLMICYKEIKDICVDEGIPIEDKVWIESHKVEHGDACVPQPSDDTRDKTCNECEMSEESDTKSLAVVRRKSSSGDLVNKDSGEDCIPHKSLQGDEPDPTSTGKVGDVPEGESFVINALPVQEYGTRSFLRSFVNTLSNEERDVVHTPNQLPPQEAISGQHNTSSIEMKENKDVQALNLLYNSKVEVESITFNFNSAKPSSACSISTSAENAKKELVQPEEDMHNDMGAKAKNLSDVSRAQCTDSMNGSTGYIHDHEQSSDPKIGNADGGGSPDDGRVKCSSSSGSTTGVHDHGVDVQNVSKHDGFNSSGFTSTSQGQCDGESSFSAAGLITYSGPIAYSASLSRRSDSSATSTRSFAFPVLQNEWNTSPVRMAKADRKQFRRDGGWRSSLLCCRF